MRKQLIFFAIVLFSLQCAFAKSVNSLILFGDSLSDNGNVTHLLRSLRKEESASYIETPFKNYIIRRIHEEAAKNHVPKIFEQAAQKIVAGVFDKILAPLVVEVISSVQNVPVVPQAPYWQNHFSNGQVWNEYLARSLGLSAVDAMQYENHAFGGSWAATTDKDLSFTKFFKSPGKVLTNIIKGKLIPPSLGITIESYLLEKGKADPSALYIVFSGGNDYINALDFNEHHDVKKIESYADNVTGQIISATNKLITAGAKNIVVFGVPNVGITPHFNQTADREILTHASNRHNHNLATAVETLRYKHTQVNIGYIDVQALLQELMDEPAKYGISNTTDACIDVSLSVKTQASEQPSTFPNNYVLESVIKRESGNYSVCTDPDSYLFWDDIHPTTHAHQALSDRVCSIIAKDMQIDC